jgi:hypothetical protein
VGEKTVSHYPFSGVRPITAPGRPHVNNIVACVPIFLEYCYPSVWLYRMNASFGMQASPKRRSEVARLAKLFACGAASI